MTTKTYTDDQLPIAAIHPGMFTPKPKLTHAQKALLVAFKKLPGRVQGLLLRQAEAARMDYIEGRDIRDAAAIHMGSRESLQDVLHNSLADSMATEPDVLADTTDDDPFWDTTETRFMFVRKRV